MTKFTDESIRWILTSFDNGWSTAAMAKRWPEWTEAELERALHVGLTRRRLAKLATAMGPNT